LFRSQALEAQALGPYDLYPALLLDDRQQQSCAETEGSGSPIGLEDDHWIVKRGESWIILLSEDGLALVDVNESLWGDQEDEEDLRFTGPAEALTTYLRLSRIEAEIDQRRKVAFEKLGRTGEE
jgi:hypothetical protein